MMNNENHEEGELTDGDMEAAGEEVPWTSPDCSVLNNGEDIDPPVMLKCYKCGDDAIMVIRGWVLLTKPGEERVRRRPVPEDFHVKCWPCRQKAGELHPGLNIQDIIVIPPEWAATPQDYEDLNMRLPIKHDIEQLLTIGIRRARTEEDDGCIPVYGAPIKFTPEEKEAWDSGPKQLIEEEGKCIINSKIFEKGHLFKEEDDEHDKEDSTDMTLDLNTKMKKTYHATIELPQCAKCKLFMGAFVLVTPEEENIPVFYCTACKRIHKVTTPELLNWLACGKLTNRRFIRHVEEGNIYRV